MGIFILGFFGGVAFAILGTLTAQAIGKRMAEKEMLP